MKYSFNKQLAVGQEYEKLLDRHFGRNFIVGKHPDHAIQKTLERGGVDRVFQKKITYQANQQLKTFTAISTVEYKADQIGHTTGNVFLEIELRHKDGRVTAGWAPKILAQSLVYLFTASGEILICISSQMKDWLPYWATKCQWRTSKNPEYLGWGLLVPRKCSAQIMGFEKACVERIEEIEKNGEQGEEKQRDGGAIQRESYQRG